jgi:hypothetical protein
MALVHKPRACNLYSIASTMLILILVTMLYQRQPQVQQTVITLVRNSTAKAIITSEYLHVDMDLEERTGVCEKHDVLIVYILSTISNFRRRQVIRATWASKQNGTCFLFILGQVAGRTPDAGSLQLKVKNEKKEHGDIVQIDHVESYENVIYKEVAALIWTKHFYPEIPFLFKTDDDLILDSILVSSMAEILVKNTSKDEAFLKKHRPALLEKLRSVDREHFFRGGWAMDYQPTVRGGGKFSVPEEVWPHSVLPAYCSGFGWLMSKWTRNRLVDASLTYPKKKIAWVGDVFLSGFIAREAKVNCTGLEIDFDQTASANCSCLMVNNPMLTVCSSSFHVGGGAPTEEGKLVEYQLAWKMIQLRHNLSHTDFRSC